MFLRCMCWSPGSKSWLLGLLTHPSVLLVFEECLPDFRRPCLLRAPVVAWAGRLTLMDEDAPPPGVEGLVFLVQNSIGDPIRTFAHFSLRMFSKS